MRIFARYLAPSTLLLAACSAAPAQDATDPVAVPALFDPPPLAPGYTRVVAPIVQGIEPGGDAIRCQYVLTPFDRDMDVLDIKGVQSSGGHHSIAYAVHAGDVPIGTSRECNATDNTSIGGFLGGIGGEGGGNATLPEGVVFRLTAGSTVMLNTHFLNTTDETIDGQTVLDIEFAEVDHSRKVASIFANFTQQFAVEPQRTTTADALCTVPRDMMFLSFTNHMHAYGRRSDTVVLRDADVIPVHEDASWAYDMQFDPVFTSWTLDAPLMLRAGDVLRTHCEWENRTAASITFPEEMCVGFGFFLTDGSSSPTCVEGAWLEASATTH